MDKLFYPCIVCHVFYAMLHDITIIPNRYVTIPIRNGLTDTMGIIANRYVTISIRNGLADTITNRYVTISIRNGLTDTMEIIAMDKLCNHPYHRDILWNHYGEFPCYDSIFQRNNRADEIKNQFPTRFISE